jgi:hypothetical protein
MAALCATLQVSRSGYYARVGRRPGARAQANTTLLTLIAQAHQQSRGQEGVSSIFMMARDHTNNNRIDPSSGTLTINGGTCSADFLFMPNGPYSTLVYNSGTQQRRVSGRLGHRRRRNGLSIVARSWYMLGHVDENPGDRRRRGQWR